jgi:hypothetical protein
LGRGVVLAAHGAPETTGSSTPTSAPASTTARRARWSKAGKTTPYLTLSKPFQSGDDANDIELINIGLGLRGQL